MDWGTNDGFKGTNAENSFTKRIGKRKSSRTNLYSCFGLVDAITARRKR